MPCKKRYLFPFPKSHYLASMQTLFRKILFLLLIVAGTVPLAKTQIKIAPTIDVGVDFISGGFAGFGLGLRYRNVEFIPYFLLGDGEGAKVEVRAYWPALAERHFNPFFSLQQVLFFRNDSCFPTDCPYTFYEFLPGAGAAWNIIGGFDLLGSISTGIVWRADNPIEGEFLVRIGGRYEF